MSIELIQTMQWTQLCWESSFENIVDLDLLLPQIGKVYPIKIERNEDFAKEGKAFILWQPPHSELNGWYEKRPSATLPTPACYVTEVTKYFLNEREHQVISKVVEQATAIFEENKGTLQENQIYGAEYY